MQSSSDYLRNVIYPRNIALASRKLEAIPGMKPPRSITHLQPFLDLCNVYLCFVPNFKRTEIPLTAMLIRGTNAVWRLEPQSTGCIRAAQLHVGINPVIDLRRHGRPFVLDMDACTATQRAWNYAWIRDENPIAGQQTRTNVTADQKGSECGLYVRLKPYRRPTDLYLQTYSYMAKQRTHTVVLSTILWELPMACPTQTP